MMSEVTPEQIEEIVRFVPVFENLGAEADASLQPGLVAMVRYWTYPEYSSVIADFFRPPYF